MVGDRVKLAWLAVALAAVAACAQTPPRNDFTVNVEGRAFHFFRHAIPEGTWLVDSTGQQITIPANTYTVYLDPSNPSAVAAHKVEPLLSRRTADAAMRHVCGPERIARLQPSFLLPQPTFTCEAAAAATR